MMTKLQAGSGLIATAFLGIFVLVTPVLAQAPAGASGAQGRGGGRNGGGGRGNASGALATFPAQQRPPGDPVIVAHGKTLYIANCQTCHAADLRGSDKGNSLLRSQTVLSDQDGELIKPIVLGSQKAGSQKAAGMPAFNLGDAEIAALATYIHSIVATEKGQGAPPAPGVEAPSALVGDANSGKVFFEAKCVSCHSVTGDLQGFGTRYPDAKGAQNRWVAGGGRGGRGAAGTPNARTVMVTVTPPAGEKVEGPLVLVDDFLVSLSLPDGTIRTFRRDGAVPKVEIKDPMQAHKTLLSTLTNKEMHDVTAYLVSLK